ncbi:nitroreductase family protein [Paenibacillus tundrae]
MGKYQKTNDFNEIVFGRRTVKVYDPEVKISHEEMTEILEEATRAPSSINLQPWRFLIIESDEGKEKLSPLVTYNQKQIKTAAAVIAVFMDMKHIENMERILNKEVELGYKPADIRDLQLNTVKPGYTSMSESELRQFNTLDTGLVSMQLMLVARAHGYDTNAIGGYDRSRINDVFGLDKERYPTVMLITIGKGAREGHRSYRLPVDEVATWV